MKATLSNMIHLAGLSFEQEEQIRRSLCFENPKFLEARQFGRSTRSMPQYLMLFEETALELIVPRGVRVDGLESAAVVDHRHSQPVAIATNITPRDYQERAIALALAHDGGVIVAPTGAGKTTMAIELAARLGQRCLILVKSKDLARQWQGAVRRFTGLDCGLIGGGQWQEGAAFTVGLFQTLVKHPGSLDYGLVIVDECHNVPAMQAYTVVNRQAARYRFGLSATPQRRDNLELMIHAALGPVVAEVPGHELDGAVLPVVVATVAYPFTGNPDSWPAFLALLEADPQRNRWLVAKALKSSEAVGTAVLTATVGHAEALFRQIGARCPDALLLHGQLPDKERKARMDAAGRANLIVGTLSLLAEGIDWPHVGSIIFAAPVSAALDKEKPAATRLLQSIGRARRPYPGKTRAYVLDVVDNHPFGRCAFNKRQEIYRQQGFNTTAMNNEGCNTQTINS